MPQQNVTITTPDGACPAAVFTPANSTGPWPAVIFFMDAIAIRPLLWQMGQRLADAGYLVLLPDLFYRDGPYAPKSPMAIFTDPAARETLMKSVASLTPARKVADTGAFLAWLDANPDVKGDKYGATGYCMGGNWSLTAAGAYPDKFAAAASYHGGGLATEAPDSPHLALKHTQARIYVAGAIEDEHFTDAQKATLEAALTDASIPHVVETYDAKHGFTMADLPVYDEAAAERHWTSLLALFHETLT
jgi:carboxymethylenebutenolidase